MPHPRPTAVPSGHTPRRRHLSSTSRPLLDAARAGVPPHNTKPGYEHVVGRRFMAADPKEWSGVNMFAPAASSKGVSKGGDTPWALPGSGWTSSWMMDIPAETNWDEEKAPARVAELQPEKEQQRSVTPPVKGAFQ